MLLKKNNLEDYLKLNFFKKISFLQDKSIFDNIRTRRQKKKFLEFKNEKKDYPLIIGKFIKNDKIINLIQNLI